MSIRYAAPRSHLAVLALLILVGLLAIVPVPADAHHTPSTDNAEPAVSADGPQIVFPVVGPVTYTDTWGACRGPGCSRSHKGIDIFALKLAPLVAAEAGTITFMRQSALTIAGNTIIVTTDDGWRYLYIHLNNDSPGTDDGANPQAWIVPGRLTVGDRVEAGQVIGYLGDSGNAETTPAHLHFEIHPPGQGAINPTPMVAEADRAGRRVPVASLASTSEGRAAVSPRVDAWYQALLGRQPTDEEAFAWSDRLDIGLATEDDLIADLTMAKPRRDRAGDIVRSFRVALDRLPTINEIRQWDEAMAGGLTLEDLNSSLVSSNAFQAEHGQLDDEGFIRAIYDNAIGQQPSATRLQDWLEHLANGNSRATVAAYWADSYAVKNSTWHGLEVIQAYRASLDRLPDDEDYVRWVEFLDEGGVIADVVAAIRTGD